MEVPIVGEQESTRAFVRIRNEWFVLQTASFGAVPRATSICNCIRLLASTGFVLTMGSFFLRLWLVRLTHVNSHIHLNIVSKAQPTAK